MDRPFPVGPALRRQVLAAGAASALAVTLATSTAGGQSETAPPGPGIDWRTEVVALAADTLTIETGGRAFTAVGVPLGYGSDPGGPESWTLEVEWTEGGVGQRLYLYFASDGQDWWVDEIRTYDGYPQGEWITYEGPFFRTPLGWPYESDRERIEGTGSGRPGTGVRIPGVLTFTGLRLAVSPTSLLELYAAPPGGGIAAEVDPFEPGQPLHCSGILQLTPALAHGRLLGAGYRVSYRLNHPTKPAEPLTVPPQGTIESTAVGSHGEVVVFVDDPAMGVTARPTFPPDCASTPSAGPSGSPGVAIPG